MITKEQFLEIISECEKYTSMYQKVIGKPMSDEFQHGMARVLDIIQSLVEKK